MCNVLSFTILVRLIDYLKKEELIDYKNAENKVKIIVHCRLVFCHVTKDLSFPTMRATLLEKRTPTEYIITGGDESVREKEGKKATETQKQSSPPLSVYLSICRPPPPLQTNAPTALTKPAQELTEKLWWSCWLYQPASFLSSLTTPSGHLVGR